MIGTARTPAAVEEQLAKDGVKNVHIVSGDMASYDSMNKAAELAAPFLPSGLDHLIVNGAFMSTENAFLSPSDFSSSSKAQALHDEIHASLDTNVLGVVYTINAFLPLVEKGAVKKVVVISSSAADTGESGSRRQIPLLYVLRLHALEKRLEVRNRKTYFRPWEYYALLMSCALHTLDTCF